MNMELELRKLPSSQYKGVVPQPNGRWGAQIYERHRRVWLGTFSDEVDAAQAYDIAAQRFRGREAVTNFKPLSESDIDGAVEFSFLSSHSKTEIVDMLRKHTYNEELKHSCRKHLFGGKLSKRRSGFRSAWELLFHKAVTPSDVGKLNRLVIPKQYAEKHFPLKNEGRSVDNNGMLLTFEDGEGKMWRFRYSYWNSSQSYVLTKGWSRFVKEKGLQPGDMVSFWRYKCNSDGPEVTQLLIDCKILERAMNITSTVQEPVVESANQVLRLFGVNIFSSQVDGNSDCVDNGIDESTRKRKRSGAVELFPTAAHLTKMQCVGALI